MICLALLMLMEGPTALIAAASPITLTDATGQSGIQFTHTDGGCGRFYIMETVSAGLALFDYNNDGLIDIYFLNGAPLKGAKAETPPRNALYRNDGGMRFTDVTAQAGVGDTGYGLGVVAGDYDGDGDLDLYLNNYGPNVLYKNNGDGTFSDATRETGTGNGDQVGAGACFLDMDADGDLDLYVGNYLFYDYAKKVDKTHQGYKVYTNPRHYPPVPDTLFRNNGDGTFTDVSKSAGIAGHAGWAMGMVCADYDNDGDTDILIANDVSMNFLYQNDGRGQFKEVALISGYAYDIHGDEQGSMGVDCGDYNNDGFLDLYQTSYQNQLSLLFKNMGDGFFEDVSMITGSSTGTAPQVTWGTGFVDFNLDGHRDIFVACGHLQINIERYDDTSRYKKSNFIFLNNGKGKFSNISGTCGPGLAIRKSSRGSAFDDLDNDGDVDGVILNSRDRPSILRNDSRPAHHWLQVRLRRPNGNRFGVGAQVRVTAGDLVQMDEVHCGRGYQSHYGHRLYFGLGGKRRIDRIDIRWVGGAADVIRDVPVDQIITIQPGGTWSPYKPAR